MKTNRKNLLIALAMTMALIPVSAGRAAAAAIDVHTQTFYISQLGDLTVVVREGVPQTIVVRDKNLVRKEAGFTINGAPYMGKVLLTNDLTLQPGTMPLMFDHSGVIEFTFGESKVVLEYKGAATKTKDLAMMTKTLYTKGDFVIADAIGAYAYLKGTTGTFTLTLVCHIVPGEHPKVGSPVEVTFSAMGM
jgi:hypothetical protein